MGFSSLEDKLGNYATPVEMLRSNQLARLPFPFRPEHSNWRDEQRAWQETAVVFDQAHHMTDVNFKGPDAVRLLSDVGVNSFATFGKDKAKQLVVCNPEGHVIGDAILFGLEDDEVSIVGPPFASRWVEYQAEVGGYDVEVTRDDAAPLNVTGRKFFRWQLQGPNSLLIAAQASAGTLPDIKTFEIGRFAIAGRPVRALNHSMTRRSGLEIWGAKDDGPAVLEALLAAGAEFGLRQAGSIAYSTTAIESGWLGMQLPAIYSGASMKGYREWLGPDVAEAIGTIGGSFVSDNIEDYYTTPYDLGYGRLVKFDHDFIGRSALEAMADQPHRKKVWLRWRDDDATAVWASSMFGGDARAKSLDAPYPVYSTFPADKILSGDKVIGFAVRTGYTVNVGSWFSLGMVDEVDAIDGAEVTLVWGEEPDTPAKPAVERHVQATVRATVSTTPLA